MLGSISNRGPTCIHSSHLLSRPLCKDQFILKRIANVVFHVFTLGIPFSINYFINWRRHKTSPQVEGENLQQIAVYSVEQNNKRKPYSAKGIEAIQFARDELAKHPDLQPYIFPGFYVKLHQPINEEIALLHALCKKYTDDFFKVFKESSGCWDDPEVMKAADECMKIAYAVSNLTLDELEAFTDKLSKSENGENRTYAEALTIQDSYQYRTFYNCTRIYHFFRSELVVVNNQDGSVEVNYLLNISKRHATQFYKKETMQNSWNELYNNYCERIRLYVNDIELDMADSRHVNWTQKDTGISSFKMVPDTEPT